MCIRDSRYVDPPDVALKNIDLTGKGSYYVSAVSRSTDENGIVANFSIRLASAPTDNITIYLKTSDATEGRISRVAGTAVVWSEDNKTAYVPLFISKDSWNSPKTVEVTGQWDNLSDGDQSYAIILSSDNTTKDKNYLYVDPPDASLSNLDLTDKGTFYVTEALGDTDENETWTTFTVRLSSAPNSGDNSTSGDNVTIKMRSSDPGEGVITNVTGGSGKDDNSTLVFTASDWSAERTVTVTGVADNYSDGDQNYTIILSQDNDTTDMRFRYVDPPDVSLKNIDLTGKGGYYISAISNDTDENKVKATFNVRLATAPTSDVKIWLKTSDASEGRISKINNTTVSWNVDPDNASADNTSSYVSLLIEKDEWNSNQTIEVEGQWDNISDGDQSYAIIIEGDNQTDSDRNYRYVDPPDVTLTNLDLTDKGTFYVSKASRDTDENGQKATFTVRLSSQPDDGDNNTTNDNVTIYLSSSDPDEGKIVGISGGGFTNTDNRTVIFKASDWNSERTVTVEGVADNFSDGDQNYTIILSPDNDTEDRRFRYVDPPDVALKNIDLTGKGSYLSLIPI